MKELSVLNVFFWKYRFRFFTGILLVIATNYLAVLSPQITGYVVNLVQAKSICRRVHVFELIIAKIQCLYPPNRKTLLHLPALAWSSMAKDSALNKK